MVEDIVMVIQSVNMSDEQGAYALTVNLTTQNLFPQSSQGLPVLINETKLQIENLYMF